MKEKMQEDFYMKKISWIKAPVDTGSSAVNFKKVFCVEKTVKKVKGNVK